MESFDDIKEALSARSRTATLDELRSEGKKRVRLIRAEHVATMIREAVHNTIEHSGLVAPDDVEKIVDKSRAEFRSILQQREAELQRARDNEEALAEREQQIVELRQQLADSNATLAATRARLDRLEGAAAGAAPAHAPTTTSAPAAAPAGGHPSNELLLSLMNEMASMKASMLHPHAVPAAAPAAAAPGTDVSAAIEKLAGSLTDRLEKLGKKMGVSAAVESDQPVDFSGMFKDTGKELESNIENIEVKQKAGGGIAANLARLKKLKGGG
jgi:DNA mismatch repair ATPase MutL